MDKTQAAKHIESIFGKAFDRETYEHFLGNLLNEYEPRGRHYSGNLIPHAFKEHITQYWRVGKYVDPNHLEMDLLVVEVKSLAKLDRARTALRNFAVNRLRAFEKEYSLIAFYAKEDMGSDWRFSFIKTEPVAYQDEIGKVKTKKELTPAKRYSFLVGEHENSHTAQSQLLDVLVMDYARPTIEDIENAFSIEKVTKDFFNQYKDLFLLLTDHLVGEPHFKKDEQHFPNNVYRFSKKLLGQIVFLYFLQKKGWLGVPESASWGNGDKKFLRHQLNTTLEKDCSFYTDSLQYLFYEALAKERIDQKNKGYYPRLGCKIPFLNGGLFEPDYDWETTDIHIPNTIFTNDEKNKFGDLGTGILDVFDRYNFTIKEDEPLEKEVAVDPEMLGKVFENMLDVTERKSKGAFYTPREIVHYMCQESLIHFLDNALNDYGKLTTSTTVFEEPKDSLFANESQQSLFPKPEQDKISVPKKDIESLIRKGHLYLENDSLVIEKGKETSAHHFKMPVSVQKYAKKIDTLLADIKICDPAIGSGAFPVGMLHEIVNTRQVLAPYTKNNQTAYDYKRHAIHESIYGVDYDASAIDIARLRLWLSLVVDEEDYNSIKALPNLDYKIVQGNSLIGLNDRYRPAWLSQIEKLKEEVYQCKDQKERAKLKEKINQKLHGYLKDSESMAGFNSKSASGYKVDFDFKLFFSEVWDQNDGFDIIIGNPPYVQIQNFSGQQIQKDLEKQQFETFAKTGDIYCLFYEKGYRLLKNGGGLCFITSNKWMRANYGKKLRSFFNIKTNPLVLIDFSSFHVFETATVDTNILLFEKAKNRKSTLACKADKAITQHTNFEKMVEDCQIILNDLNSNSWIIVEKDDFAVKKQIEKIGVPLEKWDASLFRGIVTGYNEAFIIDKKTKLKLESQDQKNSKVLKPVLSGRDIKRYQVNFKKTWLLFIPWHFPLHEDASVSGASNLAEEEFKKRYHYLYQYLEKHKTKLSSRNKSETGIRYEWYALQRCAASYYREFEKQKIVWGNLALSAQFALADPDVFINAPSNMITSDQPKYLLAILNSKVSDYYIRSLGVTRNGGYFEYKPMFVEKLPVPQIDSDDRLPLEILVDFIPFLIKNEKKLEAAYFEQIIDGLVYELYFQDDVKKAKKEINTHLGTLSPISNSMTDNEKLIVIKKEFDRLYDPDHLVRNHIETLDSIPVVKTIQDALKR
ncbi:TaqI-like C-terminal specificity domain-containing protein [Desulfobacula sp.]|uniref:Eco57I restriction-modification methylase domain-containing protein n=1 Tax=Desulfobacula sp. TaxID=2593537 RepID=UPI0026026392|nr:TaqI-like C-terminal specificity domain-containing protein [Desulfobacula sp.]